VKTTAYAYDPYGRTRTATGPTPPPTPSVTPAACSPPPPAPPNSVAATTTPTPADSPNPTNQGENKTPTPTPGTNPISWKDPSGLCGEWYSVEDCDPFNDPSVGEIWGGAVTGQQKVELPG